MERRDLEFGEVELIQDTIQNPPQCVENDVDNHMERISSSIYMASEITMGPMVGDVDMIKDSVVQRLLYHVKKEENYKNQLPPSIFMVPHRLRNISPCSYNPRLVSIGPLHREDETVQAIEGQKARYMANLIGRTKSPPEEILKLCVHKVYASIEDIKACYVWTKTYDDTEIVDMMITDACFILEFLSRVLYSDVEEYLKEESLLITANLVYDLVLLENQIPFFILDEIYQCIVLRYDPEVSLLKLIYPILNVANVFEGDIEIDNNFLTHAHHILSLLHQCYKPPVIITKGEFTLTIPSVSDLDRAGVNFEPNKNPNWPMEMEVNQYGFPNFFSSWSKPTLKMPVLNVADFTELVLRNLIAYEQTGLYGTHVTSYAFAMDTLVDSQEDVAKLVDSRILSNQLGSNEEIANLFNNLAKEVVGVDFFYANEWEKLNKYYEGYWPKNIANLKRTYFSSPWSIIALIAGIILFILTVVQTIFTIKSK